MARCDQCGNDYDKSFQVTMASRTMTFDSFECAIQALAHPARIAAIVLSGMVSSKTAPSSAACIAPRRKA
jgi:hypothetical protein